MRTFTSVLIAGLLAAAPVWAQHTAPASAGPNPDSPDYHELTLAIEEKGTLYHSVKLTKTETRNGSVKVSGSDTRYRNDFVLGDDGYAVKKTVISTVITLPDGQKIDDKSTSPEAVLMRNIIGSVSEMNFVADESLSPVRIENWPALRDRSKAAVLEAVKVAAKSANEKVPDEVVQTLTQVFDSVLGKLSSEQAAELYLKVDTLMALPHNVGLERNKPLAGEGTVNVPIGNYPMTMREAITLTEWNPERNSARLTYSYSPSPESLKAFFTDFMPRMLKQMGAPEKAIQEMQDALSKDTTGVFDMSTLCNYDMAIDTGLVRKGTCTQTTTVSMAGENMKKVEAYEFSESLTPQN